MIDRATNFCHDRKNSGGISTLLQDNFEQVGIGWLVVVGVHSSQASIPEMVVNPFAFQFSPLLLLGITFFCHFLASSSSPFTCGSHWNVGRVHQPAKHWQWSFDLLRWVAQMLPLLVPLFPVSDDESVVETLSSAVVSPLLVVIIRRDQGDDHCGHEGQDGHKANCSQRHFVMLNLPGGNCLSLPLP